MRTRKDSKGSRIWSRNSRMNHLFSRAAQVPERMYGEFWEFTCSSSFTATDCLKITGVYNDDDTCIALQGQR